MKQRIATSDTSLSAPGLSLPPRELSADALRDFAIQRKTTILGLDAQLIEYANQLRSLIPVELAKFAEESHLAQVEYLSKLVAGLAGSDRSTSYALLSAKFKEPADYGFKNNQDVVRGMKLLRSAWKGLLEVKISKQSPYVEVCVYPTGTDPFKSA